MSGYKLHFIIGLLITCIAGFYLFYKGYIDFTIINVCWMVAISFVFSLISDIDIGTSIIRKVFLISFIVFLFFNGLNLISYILGAIVIIIQFLPHRGIMHSIFMGVFLSGMLYLYFHNWYFPIIAISNFISHLMLDRIKTKSKR